MVTTNTLPVTSVKWSNFWWITYVRFGGQLLRQTVSIPIGTNCAPLLADLFLYSYENEFLDKLMSKKKLARKFNHSYRYIDDLISFNEKRFHDSSLTSSPKNSSFLRLQYLLQLLLISTYFLPEIRATSMTTNYMTNMMRLVSTLWTFLLCQSIFHQHQPTVSMHLSSFALPVVVQIIVTFYHATGPWWQDFCHRTTKLIVRPTHLRNSMADTLI